MSQKTSRAHAESRREQRKRRTRVQLVIAVVVVAVVVVAFLILLNRPTSTPTVASNFDGLTQEVVTTDGAIGLAIGDPSAPLTLYEYGDFSCPHCHDLSPIINQLINDYVRPGKLRIVYKPITFVNPATSVPGAAAAVCAAEQGKGWEMIDQVWAIYGSSGPGAYTEANLAAQAQAIGIDVNQWRSCFVSAQVNTELNAVLTEAQQKAIQGTPTLYLNDQIIPWRGPETAYTDITLAINQAQGQ